MKAHIGVDNDSGLVYSLVGTAANVADVAQVDRLLHVQRTSFAPMLDTPASRSARSMTNAKSSGVLRHAVALICNWDYFRPSLGVYNNFYTDSVFGTAEPTI